MFMFKFSIQTNLTASTHSQCNLFILNGNSSVNEFAVFACFVMQSFLFFVFLNDTNV